MQKGYTLEVGDTVEVIDNLVNWVGNPKSFTHGQKGVVIQTAFSTARVKLFDYKKFPVPYLYYKIELKKLKTVHNRKA